MATGGAPPTGRRPSVSSDFGFEPIEPASKLREGVQPLNTRIEAKFCSRTVKEVQPVKAQSLKQYSKGLPATQEKMSFRILRLAGKIKNIKSDPVNVIMGRVENAYPAVTSPLEVPGKLEDLKVDVYCEDAELLKNIGGRDATYVSVQEGLPEVLFHSGTPLPEDVRQADKRSTCFLMSALASYAASPVGKDMLTSNIMPFTRGLAVVRFYDFITQKPVNVLVSTARLVDKKGHDYYSFGNQTGANWPGVVEKAFHAYRIDRLAGLKDLQEEALYKFNDEEAGALDGHMNAITGKGGSSNYLDNANLYTSLRFFPPLPKLDAPVDENHVQTREPWVLHDGDLTGKNLELLKFNVDHGVPVVLGTRGLSEGLIEALSTGTPTDHAVAVLGPGEVNRSGERVPGVLIYDPYGESLDKGQKIQLFSQTQSLTKASSASLKSSGASAEELEQYDFGDDLEDILKSSSPMLMTKAGGRSVRFYAYEDLQKYFSTAAVASGGFDFKERR